MTKIQYAIFLLTVFLFTSHLSAIPQQPSITVNQCYTTKEAVFLLVGTRWLSAEAVNFTTDGICSLL